MSIKNNPMVSNQKFSENLKPIFDFRIGEIIILLTILQVIL